MDRGKIMAIEETLAIIKPDAVERNLVEAIIKMIEENGLVIKKMKSYYFTENEAKKFYEVHKTKVFYDKLVSYMTSGMIIAILIEGENAIAKYRQLIGSTNPNDAEEGTIRKLYAIDGRRNSVHGSDSKENAMTEIKFFFT
jgi:nucleoside-diphosphate kinase